MSYKVWTRLNQLAWHGFDSFEHYLPIVSVETRFEPMTFQSWAEFANSTPGLRSIWNKISDCLPYLDNQFRYLIIRNLHFVIFSKITLVIPSTKLSCSRRTVMIIKFLSTLSTNSSISIHFSNFVIIHFYIIILYIFFCLSETYWRKQS